MALGFDTTLNQCWRAGAWIWAFLEGAEACKKNIGCRSRKTSLNQEPAACSSEPNREPGLFRVSQSRRQYKKFIKTALGIRPFLEGAESRKPVKKRGWISNTVLNKHLWNMQLYDFVIMICKNLLNFYRLVKVQVYNTF